MKPEKRKVLDLRHGCTIDEVNIIPHGALVKIRPVEYTPYKGRRRAYKWARKAAVLAVGFATIAAVSLTVEAMTAHASEVSAKEPPIKAVSLVKEPGEALMEKPMEDPLENEKIEAALVAQGYFRDDVPLSYELQDMLHSACEANGIPYHVALGLIETESSFDPEAVSSAGCYGLAQLNPQYFPTGLSPAENMAAGMEFLGYQLDRYDGDMEAALTAYNAGHDTGARWYAEAVLDKAEKWRAGE